MKKIFCGIDLGTSALKLGLVSKKGEVVFETSVEYPIFTDGLYSEQDPLDWWKAVKTAFFRIPKNIKSKIVGISFSGQMHSMVLIDKKGNLIRNAILWNDMRTFSEVSFLNEVIGKDKVSNWTSNIALEGFTAPKLLWIRKNEPQAFKDISKILMPKDYLIYKITNTFCTDRSDASGTLYYDVKNQKWSKEMLEILKVDLNQLPKILKSSEVVGKVSKFIAQKLEISEEVLIIAGGADNPVAALSLDVLNANEATISLGTSGVIYTPISEFKKLEKNELHTFISTNNKYYHMGVINSAAQSLKWFMTIFSSKNKIEIIEKKININKKTTLLFHPYIFGERTPINDPKALGSFLGLNYKTNNVDMVHSIMEGVSFAFKEIQEILQKLNTNIKVLKITGGGSKSNAWCNILSSLLNVTIYRPKKNYGAFFGAALLAMIGTKNIDFNEVKNLVPKENEVFKPNIKTSNILIKKYKIWKKVYPQIKTINYELHDYISDEK